MSGCGRFQAAVSVCIVAASLCGCALYRKCGFGGCPGDAQITADSTALFARYPELEPPNLVYVQTLDHVVYLSGQVNTEAERELAKSVVLHLPGVKQVINSISLGYQGR